MKKRCPTTKDNPKANLELTWPVGTNFSSRMSSKGLSENVVLNIQVKCRSTPSHTSSKATTFSAKLNLVWEKLQSSSSQSWTSLTRVRIISMKNIAALWLAILENWLTKYIKTSGDLVATSTSQNYGSGVTLEEFHWTRTRRSWKTRRRRHTS